MLNLMRKIFLMVTILMLIFVNFTYGAVKVCPVPENDRGYMMENVFNNSYVTYSYSNLNIGGSSTGVTGGQYNSNSTKNMIHKTAVFELNVEKEGMITLDVTPVNGGYNVSSNINIYFVSSVSGVKKYYNPNVSSILEVGGGNCKRAFYAYPGKYFISVGGTNYSQNSMATNHRIFLEFSIKAMQEFFQVENNKDTSQSNPYRLDFTDSVVINGNIGMKAIWGSKWYVDKEDGYIFTAPRTGKINVSLYNTDRGGLKIFTKKQNYIDGIKSLSNEWKDYVNVVGSLRDPGNMGLCNLKVNPGESDRAVVDVAAGKKYRFNINNSFPCEYKVVLSYIGGSVIEKEEASLNVEGDYIVNGYNMVQHKEYKGQMSQEASGVKMVGDIHTNGRLVNNYRDGNRIDTVNSFDVKNKTVYGSFTVYGTNYCAYTGLAVENIASGGYVTTHHSWAGSKVVKDGTKIYKTLSFTDDTWKMTISTGNYYGKPKSILIEEKSGSLSEAAKKAINSPQKIIFFFGDNYGGPSNYMIIHDLFIEDNDNKVVSLISDNHNMDTASHDIF